MKVFKYSMVALAVIVIGVIIHIICINEFNNNVFSMLNKTEQAYERQDIEQAIASVSDIEALIKKNKLWLSVTLDTADIEKLETALERLKKFAQIKNQADFYGELITFKKMVDSLPYTEGISWEIIF